MLPLLEVDLLLRGFFFEVVLEGVLGTVGTEADDCRRSGAQLQPQVAGGAFVAEEIRVRVEVGVVNVVRTGMGRNCAVFPYLPVLEENKGSRRAFVGIVTSMLLTQN